MALEILPGAALKFDADDERKLGRLLQDYVGELEDQHAPLRANLSTWWDWFDAVPAVTRREDPFPGSSNIVLPLIQIHSDAITARTFNTIFGARDIWTVRNRNDLNHPVVQPVIEFSNWAADGNEYDLMIPTMDWLQESVPIGSSVMALGWTRRQRQVFLPGDGGKPKPITIDVHNGPFVQQIPREDILWEVDAPLQESSIVDRRSLMPWSRIARMVRLGPEGMRWDKDAVANIQGRVTTTVQSNNATRSTKHKQQGVRDQGPVAHDPYDIRETWIEWPLLNAMGIGDPARSQSSTPTPPIVVTWERQTGTILRVIAKPYFIEGWPFYDTHYRRRGARVHHSGLCKMFEHLQRGGSTMINQAIDAVTISNSIMGITSDAKLANQKWSPNKFLIGDPNSFAPVSLNKLISPDISLLHLLMGFAERMTGINDPNLGREVRLGGHPSPATSTLTMLRESQELMRAQLGLIRRQLSRFGEDVATLYQQFETNIDGKLQRVLGDMDAEMVEKWLIPRDRSIRGNIQFDLKSVNETLNPEEERSRALFVSQVTADYYSRVLQAIEVVAKATNEGIPPMAAAAAKSIEALTESYTRILEASDVDNIRKFAFELGEANSARAAASSISEAGDFAGERLREVVQGDQGPAVPAGPNGAPVAPGRAVPGSGF